jgi:CubicO group peptidase (beta-lactamase class C family)
MRPSPINRLRRAAWLALSFVGLVVAGCAGKDKEEKPAPQTKEELEQRLREVLQKRKVPGACVALVTNDDVLWVEGLGEADRAAGQAVTPATRFRVGSITKSFVSLAVLKLQEQGRLHLDDLLRDVAPDVAFANPWEETEPLRLVHLLEHTAGLDDLQLCEYAVNDPAITLRDGLAFHPQARRLRWPPGRHFSYSNAGPAMAARAIEEATGQRFEDYVAEQIFVPLQMESASFFRPEGAGQDLAKSYQSNGKTEVPFSHILVRPSGSVSATPGDMGRLVQLLLNRRVGPTGRLLRPESVERMERPATTLASRNGLRAGYGLGNFTRTEKGFLFHGHDGGIDGFLSSYGYAPDSGVGYFFAINASNGQALEEIGQAIRAYLTSDQDKPEPPAAGRPEGLEGLAGYYQPITPRIEKTRFLERLLGVQRVSAHDGRLWVADLLSPAKELIPVSPTLFRGEDEPIATAAFVEDGADGRVLQGWGAAVRGNYRPVPAWRIWAEGGAAGVCAALMLSAVLFALVWVPRWLLRRLRGVPGLSVRVLPLFAVLWLVGAFVLLAVSGEPPHVFERFGRLTPWSAALCALTCLFALTAVLGLLQALRGRRLGVRRAVRLHALLVSIANSLVAAYLAYWGIIGLRTWA